VRQPAPVARCGRTDSWFYNRRHRSFQKILSPGVLYPDGQVEEGDPSTNSRAGIRIFGFKDGLLHTKSIVVDRQVAVFGSVNLDVRSFFKYAPFLHPPIPLFGAVAAPETALDSNCTGPKSADSWTAPSRRFKKRHVPSRFGPITLSDTPKR